jgi:hypothetical protein
MRAQDDTSQFTGAERYQHAAPDPDPMAQRLMQEIGKRLVERDGQTDVAIQALFHYLRLATA